LLAGLSAVESDPKLILGDRGSLEAGVPKEKVLLGWVCAGAAVPKLVVGDGGAPPSNMLLPPCEGLEEPNRPVDVEELCPKVLGI
jgi:hypothetical protein